MEAIHLLILLIAMFLGIIIYLFKKYNSNLDRLEAEGLQYRATFDYKGGLDDRLPEIMKWVEVYPEKIKILFDEKQGEYFYNSMSKVRLMTKEQMESYISMSRVALAGVFALAMKKQREVSSYFVVIEMDDGQSILLSTDSRSKCEKMFEVINNNIQKSKQLS